MKKIIIRLLIALIVLIVLAAVAVHLFLDSTVKRVVETMGPEMTKVQVKLEGVNIVLLSGSGSLKGLVVGNPEGYKTPSAINVSTLGKSATAALPEIRLKDLGRDPEGITPAELSKKVLQALEASAAEAAKGAIADLTKGAVYLSNDLGKTGTNTLQKTTRGLL